MKCAEIMTESPNMCIPEDGVSVAVEIMWNSDCGIVPVVKDLESNELVGMITDRDVAMHVVKHVCAHPLDVKVGDCMSSNIVTCQPDDSLEAVIQLMCKHHVRRIPVVDEKNSCVGIVSQSDLIINVQDVKTVMILLRELSTPLSTAEDTREKAEKEIEEATEKAAVADEKQKKPSDKSVA